jgi:hypothetical protein
VATTLALIAASAGSAGGVVALIVKKVRPSNPAEEVRPLNGGQEHDDAQDRNA